MNPIFTIGYGKLTPDALESIAGALGVTLIVDVRASPRSRKPGFSRTALERQFGARYLWAGDELGGSSKGAGVTTEGIHRLIKLAHSETVLLMCLEECPGDCHRHHDIAPRLAAHRISVWHVCADEIIDSRELERAIAEKTDYACYSLNDFTVAGPVLVPKG